MVAGSAVSEAGLVGSAGADMSNPTLEIDRVDIDPDPTGPIGPRPIIDMDQIWKSYHPGDFTVNALRGVSLVVNEGDLITVIGPSGSGKSTLMQIMGCLDVPSQGTYRLDGEDVSEMPESKLSKIRNKRIGFVFQQYNLMARLSAWRNVELPLIYGGMPPHERRSRAMGALDMVGLSDRVDHRPNQLSGGQQQRVAIARALVTDPAVVLADEPTGNLDSEAASDILRLMRQLHQSGRTVVIITHDSEVAAIGGRMLQIRDGRILADGESSLHSPKHQLIEPELPEPRLPESELPEPGMPESELP